MMNLHGCRKKHLKTVHTRVPGAGTVDCHTNLLEARRFLKTEAGIKTEVCQLSYNPLVLHLSRSEFVGQARLFSNSGQLSYIPSLRQAPIVLQKK